MRTENNRKYFPIILLFFILNILIFLFKNLLEGKGFNISFLLIANSILFLLTLAGFVIQGKAINSQDAQKFVRSVYASMMIKMFICMIAILIYMVMNRQNINKPSLFASMGIYIFYTIIEVSGLMKAARKNTNA